MMKGIYASTALESVGVEGSCVTMGLGVYQVSHLYLYQFELVSP